jgi:hypothetical protein
MKKFQRGDVGGDILVMLVVAAFVGFLAYIGGWQSGYKGGAIDHADGKCVVVNLPDGRREVCEVKP